MTIKTIGSGVESFTQPEVPPVEASFVGIELDPITPIAPGPKVRFRYLKTAPEQVNYPRVHAVFVPASTPDIELLTPEALLDPANGFPQNFADRGSYTRSMYEIPVSGLVGGVEYTLVTVLEYTLPE